MSISFLSMYSENIYLCVPFVCFFAALKTFKEEKKFLIWWKRNLNSLYQESHCKRV